MNWALHAALVYEDWSGEFTEVDAGLGLELPMRFRLTHRGIWDTALRFTPGFLIAGADRRDDDHTVLGLRGEVGVLVSAGVHERANLVTGATVPLTIVIVDHDHGVEDDTTADVVVPILARIGVEALPIRELAAWLLVELGPTIGSGRGPGDDDLDVELGLRVWLGATYYP